MIHKSYIHKALGSEMGSSGTSQEQNERQPFYFLLFNALDGAHRLVRSVKGYELPCLPDSISKMP